MLITRKLRCTTPWLGAKRGPDSGGGRKTFTRVNKEDEGLIHIASSLMRWKWALRESRDSLGMDDISTDSIIPARYFTVKNTSTYNRSTRRGKTPIKEKYESLQTGQVISMDFTLARELPPDVSDSAEFFRVPDEEEFDAMLTHIGVHIGMSEWGHGFEFGRFELQQSEYTDDKTNNQDNKGRCDDVDQPPVTNSKEIPDSDLQRNGKGI